ncbi:uncharacterized protein LOC120355289 [Nilaparvata lugens]|uniref:uncharacterized protein LOC120355289 n=1 Tax=Nilaparvata lugens TaxID=108931 RepID=UPI00193CBD91|nr:uncharacterized protein LOC120355289 [Nilaparvata lugens]
MGLKAMPAPSNRQEAEWTRAQLQRTLLAAFVRGIQGPAATTLQVFPPKDLEEAIGIAERTAEAQLSINSSNNIFPIVTENMNNDVNVNLIQGRKVERRDESTPKRGNQKDTCYECGGFGHYGRECATRRKYNIWDM